jgi:hypothetical protein
MRGLAGVARTAAFEQVAPTRASKIHDHGLGPLFLLPYGHQSPRPKRRPQPEEPGPHWRHNFSRHKLLVAGDLNPLLHTRSPGWGRHTCNPHLTNLLRLWEGLPGFIDQNQPLKTFCDKKQKPQPREKQTGTFVTAVQPEGLQARHVTEACKPHRLIGPSSARSKRPDQKER